MTLHILTGNAMKFAEMRLIFPDAEQITMDLPEIQEADPHVIIKAKLAVALEHHPADLLVEDTSLSFDCLDGLPGPFIKWFVRGVGNERLYELASKMGNTRATARTLLGYAKDKDHIYFFEGALPGTLVTPRGKKEFSWDPIFLPDGSSKTFAEMTREEKTAISMRRLALNKLKDFLEKGEE